MSSAVACEKDTLAPSTGVQATSQVAQKPLLSFEQMGLEEKVVRVQKNENGIITGVLLTGTQEKAQKEPVRLSTAYIVNVLTTPKPVLGDEVDCLVCRRVEGESYPAQILVVSQIIDWEKNRDPRGVGTSDESKQFDFHVVLMRDMPYLRKLFLEKEETPAKQ